MKLGVMGVWASAAFATLRELFAATLEAILAPGAAAEGTVFTSVFTGVSLVSWFTLWLSAMVAALAASLAAAALTRQLGPRRGQLDAGRRRSDRELGALTRAGLVLLCACAMAVGLRGVLAGAARAVDASAAASAALWGAWSLRIVAVGTVALATAGCVEWVAAHQRRRRRWNHGPSELAKRGRSR